MGAPKKIAVSEAKAHFLELIRQVEKGQVFEVSKGGKVVAILTPQKGDLPRLGFSKGKITGDILETIPFDYDPNEKFGNKK